MNTTINSTFSNSLNVGQNNEILMTFNFNYFLLMIIKLSLSTLFSFIISFEREMHSHPGGVCTHILVGYGSCLFTMISVNLRNNYSSTNYDPARVAAQVVSGMGFLGSATIFKSNNYVKGINTAANLWISAALSMAVAVELWELSFVTSFFTVFILFVNNRYKMARYGKKKKIEMTNISTNTTNNTKLSMDPKDAPYGNENKIIND